MAAARFSNDVLEMFYGSLSQEENRRQKRPIDFNLERNNFNGWLRSWKINVPEDYPSRGDLLQFAPNTKTRFTTSIDNEMASLGSIKTKFGLLAKFTIFRNEQIQYMEHCFAQRDNEIFNRNNEESINTAFNRFIDEIKGEIEAWSQRGSGWVLEGILAVYVNVAVSWRKLYAPA